MRQFKNEVKLQVCDSLGKIISEVRKEKNISQDELAKNVKISRTFLSLIENGRRFPSMQTFKKIALCFDIKATDLLLRATEIDDLDEDFKMLKILNDVIASGDKERIKQIITSIKSINQN